MRFISKLNPISTFNKVKDAEGAEVWLVSWRARNGAFSSDWAMATKAFLSKSDAEAFAKSLQDAQRVLQYAEDIRIKITKQL